MRKKKKKKITVAQAREFWGERYMGAGFMRSIGFKVKKCNVGENYRIYKINIVKKRAKVEEEVHEYLCMAPKEEFMRIAMENGFDPRIEMESDSQPGGFGFEMENESGKIKSTPVNIREVIINKNALKK